MKYTRRESTILLSDAEIISTLKSCAAVYNQYANHTLLFIYRFSKSKPFEKYEVSFGFRNFMHLAGIDSKSKNAEEFYLSCLDGTIKIEDCNSIHGRTNMCEKISTMKAIIDLRYGKCYKIGEKDLVTKDNDFEMALGNNSGVIGCTHRVSLTGTKQVNKNKKPIPLTLVPKPISDYCTEPSKINFILMKTDDEEKYSTVFFEIKKDLLYDCMDDFEHEILELFSEELFKMKKTGTLSCSG